MTTVLTLLAFAGPLLCMLLPERARLGALYVFILLCLALTVYMSPDLWHVIRRQGMFPDHEG